MTYFARAALNRLVDMDIMKIEHAVAEVSFPVSPLTVRQRIGMAAKTEFKISLIV